MKGQEYHIRRKEGAEWWIAKRLSKPRGYKRIQDIHGPFPNEELAKRELLNIKLETKSI